MKKLIFLFMLSLCVFFVIQGCSRYNKEKENYLLNFRECVNIITGYYQQQVDSTFNFNDCTDCEIILEKGNMIKEIIKYNEKIIPPEYQDTFRNIVYNPKNIAIILKNPRSNIGSAVVLRPMHTLNPDKEGETSNIVMFLVNTGGSPTGGLGLKLCGKVGSKGRGCWCSLGIGNVCGCGSCIRSDRNINWGIFNQIENLTISKIPTGLNLIKRAK